MIRPGPRFALWLALACWFAAGVGGLRTATERETYAQMRALLRGSTDLAADRALLGEAGEGPRPMSRRPGAALAGVPFFWLGRLVGAAAGDDPANPCGLTAQIACLAAAFAGASGLLLLGLIALEVGARPAPTTAALALAAAATPLAAYGARLADPAFGLLALTMTVYPLLRARGDDQRLGLRLLLGAGLGLMLLLGDAFLLLWPLFALWTARGARRLLARPSYAAAVVVPLSLGVFCFAVVNAAAWGGPLNAPDGLPLWRHFWREYYFHAALASNFVFRRALPALGFWLFNQGPMPERLALAQGLPAPLRNEIFLGVYAWCPLLAAGAMGAAGLRRDPDARHSLRLVGLAFWAAVLLAALGEHTLDPREYNAAATLPFWVSGLCGLGFFLEYHLWLMRGFLLKNALRALFAAALVVSLGNAWWEAAQANVGPPPRAVLGFWPAPAATVPPQLGHPGSRAALLPASPRDAFFLNANRALDWASRDAVGCLAAWRPGVGNLALFLPVLAALGLLPSLGGIVLRRRIAARRSAGAVRVPPPVRPPRSAADEPPPAPPDDDDDWPEEPHPREPGRAPEQ